MESVQTFLTYLFNIVWYGFFTLFIFDFLIGLPAFMREVELKKSRERAAMQTSVKTDSSKLPDTQITSVSNSDEATMQYLEMTGCDIEDFTSISQAREFLDENAAWTIETAPMQKVQEIKLSFEQVRLEFAQIGWVFQKHRTGHYRYRVNVNGVNHRFKTLQDALDWLSVSKRLLQAAAPY
jgi:hypothetical protein